ncbi:glycosyl hydrolase [Novosphingobium album (ex Hu et al. 2023)]|uniref:Glycoside hydrolase family protein n=1 Tax=Novosphingobium album (ex Hu et al. 2023) TaxID=2930093 RepID=A0ABT0B5B1_9SPHN|nr:glycosyl hydrolase [Novosphingobium album (ex Hu et al. 2023)]MCJ2180227.1 glycoside hydrolase family protein [Novosphingobium album (ex Hu et al. 2023)]
MINFRAVNRIVPVGAAALLTVTAHAAPPQKTVANAAVTVEFGKSLGPMPQPERYNNLTDFDLYTKQRVEDVKFYNQQGLHGSIYRVWLAEKLYDPASETYDIDQMAAYLADAGAISDTILLNVMPSRLIMEGKTPAQMAPILTRLIRDLKLRFPKLEYIEAFNEPDHSLSAELKPEDLYRYYVPFYEAVDAVNRDLKPELRIKLGGPALFMFSPEWLNAFLDGYAADPSPDKKLDFLSYHAYGLFYLKPGTTEMTKPPVFFKENPEQVAAYRPLIEAELRKRGLDEHLPTYITEMGLYPGPSFDNMADARPDYLRQAAGMASLAYWFLEDKDNVPFNWVLRHQTEERKDQLITRAGKDNPVPVRTFSPYGNMMLMMAKLKGERVPVVSSGRENGKGIYAFATHDKTGAAVMVWNYQHTGEQTITATVNMDDLPEGLRNRKLRQRTFLIDGQTSNYWADPQKANLQQVGEARVSVKSDYTLKTRLGPNAVELIVLEPEG